MILSCNIDEMFQKKKIQNFEINIWKNKKKKRKRYYIKIRYEMKKNWSMWYGMIWVTFGWHFDCDKSMGLDEYTFARCLFEIIGAG